MAEGTRINSIPHIDGRTLAQLFSLLCSFPTSGPVEGTPAFSPASFSDKLKSHLICRRILHLVREFPSSGLAFEYSGNGNKPISSPSRVARARSLFSWQVTRPVSSAAGRHTRKTRISKNFDDATPVGQAPCLFSKLHFPTFLIRQLLYYYFVQRENIRFFFRDASWKGMSLP